jgi:crossover junction endodeoxyribonuclease RuvC
MIIMGVDPGSLKIGYGFIRFENNVLTYLDSGVLTFVRKKEENFVDRLASIYQGFIELVEKHRPNEIAVESLVFVKNINSLAKLAQARGAICAALSQTHKGLIFEYEPNLVKKAISSYGLSSKLEVQNSVKCLLGIKTFERHDESDALAIALCHSFYC